MARDAAFWRWYAEVNDSVRQEVVERGWYQRETTANLNEYDVPGMRSQDIPEGNPYEGTVWQQEHPNGAHSAEPNPEPQSPNIEPPEQEQE